MKILEQRNVVLFIGTISDTVIKELRMNAARLGRDIRIAILREKRGRGKGSESASAADIVLECDPADPQSITAAFQGIVRKILAVSVRGEKNIPFFAKIRPHLPPGTNTMSAKALERTMDQALLRKKLRERQKSLCPRFAVVRDGDQKSLELIGNEVGFPLIIKPAKITSEIGLMYVCYYREELERALAALFRKMPKGEQVALAEEFLEGEVYSFDTYVTPQGKIHLCPPIEIRTGRSAGFDDLFSYMQITPPVLSKTERAAAEGAVRTALEALELTGTSAHIEVVRSDDQWKVVNVSPVSNGWRNDLYMLSYGIDHLLNDVLVRIPRKLVLSAKVTRHSAVIRFYAHKEGRLVRFAGSKKIKDLTSFFRMRVRKKTGDLCRYAKHGDVPVLDLTLSNTDRAALLADIRRAEQAIKIITA